MCTYCTEEEWLSAFLRDSDVCLLLSGPDQDLRLLSRTKLVHYQQSWSIRLENLGSLDTCSVLNLFLVFVQITANLLSLCETDWIVLPASGNTSYLTSWCPSWHWNCRHFSSPFVTPIDPQGEKRGFFVRPGAVSNYLEKKFKKLHIVEHIIVLYVSMH